MLGLIGETQSTFVKRQQMLDEALLANEVVHWVTKSKKRCLLFKLDFQKAYNTVRWDFVNDVLQPMGFSTNGGSGLRGAYPQPQCLS